MGIISVTTIASETETITRTKLNGLAANLVTEFNGNIENSNIKASADISATKLDLSTIAQNVEFTGTVTLPDGALLKTSAAPTTDAMIANKKYVDDSVTTDAVTGDGTVNPTNLLSNGDFEAWSAGTSAAPDGWALPGAGSIARESTEIKIGTYSAKLTAEGTASQLRYTFTDVYLKGRNVTLSCWVKSSNANDARISIYDNVSGYSYSSYHTGGGDWELLTVTKTISLTAATMLVDLIVATNTQFAYFDGAMLVEGASTFAFADKPAGTWLSYTPTMTNFTTGNGTVEGAYTRSGDTVHYYIDIVLGSTSAVTGSLKASLPIEVQSLSNAYTIGRITLLDFGTSLFYGFHASGSDLYRVTNASGGLGAINATSPFTFATGDKIMIQGTYKAA